MLIISPTATVSPLAHVEDSVRGTKIIIKDGASIDSFVRIKPAGGTGDLVIGENAVINAGVVIYTGNGVTIGRDTLIGANSVLSGASHEFLDRNVPIRRQGFMPAWRIQGGLAGIEIEDDVWIGSNCVVHEGTRVGKGAVITAGSVVKGTYESYAIYGGNPLRCVGRRRD